MLLLQDGESKLLGASNSLQEREARLRVEADEMTSRSDALDRLQAQLLAREVCSSFTEASRVEAQGIHLELLEAVWLGSPHVPES